MVPWQPAATEQICLQCPVTHFDFDDATGAHAQWSYRQVAAARGWLVEAGAAGCGPCMSFLMTLDSGSMVDGRSHAPSPCRQSRHNSRCSQSANVGACDCVLVPQVVQQLGSKKLAIKIGWTAPTTPLAARQLKVL